MCRIAGWVDFSRDLSHQEQIMNKMTDALIYGEQGDSRHWFSNHVAFGYEKPIAIEPENGHHPIVHQINDCIYALLYNGELYNTEDVRKELFSLGHTFRDHSDTEVILNAYIEWGEGCAERFNGIFAFAIWDENKESLFLARDRIGIKPLFYSIKNNSFLFASEIKSLLAHPMITPTVSRDGLSEIFVMGPARTPGHGIFKDISEIKPGYCMMVDKNGAHTKRYWSLISKPHNESLESTIESVRELVYDAIKRQLVSDVPLGTMLSGGLDSSAITAIATEVYKDPIQTFSVDYTGNDVNFHKNEFQPDPDAPWAKIVSEYIATKHHIHYIDVEQQELSIHEKYFQVSFP